MFSCVSQVGVVKVHDAGCVRSVGVVSRGDGHHFNWVPHIEQVFARVPSQSGIEKGQHWSLLRRRSDDYEARSCRCIASKGAIGDAECPGKEIEAQQSFSFL